MLKQTLRSRFTCLAYQHFSFYAKKSLDRERSFSLALRVVSLFCASPVSRLQSRAWSFAYLGRFARRTKKKGRLLVVYKSPEEGRLVRPKYRENSSRLSLCCFVIYVYIFILDKTAGFSCFHFYKKYLFLPAF